MADPISEDLKIVVVRELQTILKTSGRLPDTISALYQDDLRPAIEVLEEERLRTEHRFKQLGELIQKLKP